jgi:hypothetical protein
MLGDRFREVIQIARQVLQRPTHTLACCSDAVKKAFALIALTVGITCKVNVGVGHQSCASTLGKLLQFWVTGVC